MLGNRTLAMIGIGLYVLQVLSSATDANGNSKAPDALVLISGTASLIYVIVAAVKLWTIGAKGTALALPIVTFLSTVAFPLQTPNPSNANLIVNGFKVAAFLLYAYTVYVLFLTKSEGKVPG